MGSAKTKNTGGTPVPRKAKNMGWQAHATTGGLMRALIAIPVYNEAKYVCPVLTRVLEYAKDVLVIDDGSTDDTVRVLPKMPVEVIRHSANRGYGRAMRDAFAWAEIDGYDWVITMDCDEQHEPAAIPSFLAAARENRADVVSGSRYMPRVRGEGTNETYGSHEADQPPADRRAINETITREINARLGLNLTDSFCGFKAYRVEALRRLRLTEHGYAFPMQFWVQAVAQGLRIQEIPVKLIYNDPNRTFGGPMDNPTIRIKHYQRVLHCELEKWAEKLPPVAVAGVDAGCGKE
jgi:glycosyltransferase involved in cell wall biosynthesis